MDEKYFDLLRRCKLFQNIPEEAYIDTLEYLHASKHTFRKGELILRMGDEFHHAGLVLEGVIECSYHDKDFNKFNMNHFTRGDLFGEVMACAEVSISPMEILAVCECVILFLDYRVLYNMNVKYQYHCQLAVNLVRSFACKNFFLNHKVRILSQKNLRDKILAYIMNLPPDDNGTRTLPFSKTALAEFLCVNRTALSREFSRMIRENVLRMDGRKFTLCD